LDAGIAFIAAVEAEDKIRVSGCREILAHHPAISLISPVGIALRTSAAAIARISSVIHSTSGVRPIIVINAPPVTWRGVEMILKECCCAGKMGQGAREK
jgi:hypothetical protein